MNQIAPSTPDVLLLVGNPNVGKTSLFNCLTGARARVGNYPGITVDRRSGRASARLTDGSTRELELVDVPGTYSLAARSHEEQITLAAVLGMDSEARPSVLVAVVDAGQLSRCLYLVAQLIELRLPLIVALNMADEAGRAAPEPAALERLLGVPVVTTNGQTGLGGQELLRRAAELVLSPPQLPLFHVPYPEALRRDLDRVVEALPSAWRSNVERDRALALWALSSLDEHDELVDIPVELRSRVTRVLASGRDIDLEISASRYGAIDALLARLELGDAEQRLLVTERLDRVLLHPVSGFVAFLLAMLVVFQTLFAWADPAISLIEWAVGSLQQFLVEVLPRGIFTDLVVEGVVLGVGNVIVFLPQILLLFFFIGLLEDSGYMARIAYLMDRIMRALGLHGRAFVPLLSGFACAVPAILATRTLERKRDKLLTMMVVPLMTCSARLPVYTLIIGALFPVASLFGLPTQGLLMVGMYVFSLVISFLAAWVLGRTAIRGRAVPLILELPPYRRPRLGPTVRMMREKAGQFLSEAGTVILAATIVLWALLSFPRQAENVTHDCPPSQVAETAASPARTASPACPAATTSGQSARLDNSYGARLGKTLEPALAPLGFDWKIATGIIGAFAAREVFISTLALVYGIGEVDDEALPLRDRIRRERRADGQPVYTPLVGLSLMIFFALACQCMSTLAVVKRETNGYKWPAFLFVYMTALAYACSFIVYQGGSLLGF